MHLSLANLRNPFEAYCPACQGPSRKQPLVFYCREPCHMLAHKKALEATRRICGPDAVADEEHDDLSDIPH